MQQVLINRLQLVNQGSVRLPEVRKRNLRAVTLSHDSLYLLLAGCRVGYIAITPTVPVGIYCQFPTVSLSAHCSDTGRGIYGVSLAVCHIYDVRAVFIILFVIHKESKQFRIILYQGNLYLMYELVNVHAVEQRQVGIVIRCNMSSLHIIFHKVACQRTCHPPLRIHL